MKQKHSNEILETGNNIIESTSHDNEIHSIDKHRIAVIIDWIDGLTSRYVNKAFHPFVSSKLN